MGKRLVTSEEKDRRILVGDTEDGREVFIDHKNVFLFKNLEILGEAVQIVDTRRIQTIFTATVGTEGFQRFGPTKELEENTFWVFLGEKKYKTRVILGVKSPKTFRFTINICEDANGEIWVTKAYYGEKAMPAPDSAYIFEEKYRRECEKYYQTHAEYITRIKRVNIKKTLQSMEPSEKNRFLDFIMRPEIWSKLSEKQKGEAEIN